MSPPLQKLSGRLMEEEEEEEEGGCSTTTPFTSSWCSEEQSLVERGAMESLEQWTAGLLLW